MKFSIHFVMILTLASCASSPFKEETEKQDKIVKHMSQGKQYIGGEFDSKFNSSGNDGFNVSSVGVAIYPGNSSEQLVRAAAIANAKFRLTESAPTEFKKLVQQAVGNSLGYTGEFNQIETSVAEVHGLQGIEVKHEDVACKMTVEPTLEGGYSNLKECRAIAKVSSSNLKKAYDFTLSKKYGSLQKSEVEKILSEQMKMHTSGSRFPSSN